MQAQLAGVEGLSGKLALQQTMAEDLGYSAVTEATGAAPAETEPTGAAADTEPTGAAAATEPTGAAADTEPTGAEGDESGHPVVSEAAPGAAGRGAGLGFAAAVSATAAASKLLHTVGRRLGGPVGQQLAIITQRLDALAQVRSAVDCHWPYTMVMGSGSSFRPAMIGMLMWQRLCSCRMAEGHPRQGVIPGCAAGARAAGCSEPDPGWRAECGPRSGGGCRGPRAQPGPGCPGAASRGGDEADPALLCQC